jgi:hypothetical protein
MEGVYEKPLLYWFLVLGILHGVQGKFTNYVSGGHCGSRNVVGKFILHTVQNSQNQKLVFIPRWKSKIKTFALV